ncbi:uncharacterized protein ASPGLDRAFT_735325 [Aspergillus glaucus CBS 516.65]|uniref:Uncharacterized protein n=1 Tax=Aspergillus glaucus CBS 516.65 TaxID=1160497 RepID=A0A1L9VXU3_ASPGL|nr:hypothetical protein ASPGLDRAFT_735325 [Aspergillus glaucus CBS 516.65]OJJ88734.1 hypothetical protein ASPGLDRAFT_735325 [Aspergillus glaucus CBS 516.65]
MLTVIRWGTWCPLAMTVFWTFGMIVRRSTTFCPGLLTMRKMPPGRCLVSCPGSELWFEAVKILAVEGRRWPSTWVSAEDFKMEVPHCLF